MISLKKILEIDLSNHSPAWLHSGKLKRVWSKIIKKLQGLKQTQEEDQQELAERKLELQTKIEKLVGQKVEREQWQAKLGQIQQERAKLITQLKKKEIELGRLAVEKEAMVTKEPASSYSREKEMLVKRQKQAVEQKIRKKETAQETLKQRVCNEVGAEISTPWSEVITALGDKNEELQSAYQQLTAQIIAQNKVAETIRELLAEEDQKIVQVLDSELIKELLPKVTTHYQDLELRGDALVVSDGFDSFPVSELSAGAREQVFLTLRIALASQWFQDEKMFLILDDAFIHSDQIRKEALVKSMLKLSQAGWQIICLSFDERVRDLFAQYQPDYNLLDLNEG